MKQRGFVRHLRLHRLEDRSLPSVNLGSAGQLQVNPNDYHPTRVLVRFHDPVHVAELGDRIAAVSSDRNLFAVNLADGETVPEAVSSFRGRADVAYAEPDYRVRIAALPDDPFFGDLWGLHNTGQEGGVAGIDINAAVGWDVLTGTGNAVIASIDTGVDYTHQDLAANIWTNPGEVPGNNQDDDGNGYVDDVHGYDFANGDGDPLDDHGHGTHTSGTMAAVGNNGVGITGVAWSAKVMALKFLGSDGSGFTSHAVEALDYAVEMGVKVSNNSWGGGDYSDALYEAIARARDAGHIFVVASGNNGYNIDEYEVYPAAYDLPNVVAVAALDRNDQMVDFSNFGQTYVELGAPGVEVLSTLPNDSYGIYSGTSMATPHVAGALALIRDLHPDWTYRQAIGRLIGSAHPTASLQGRTFSGGRLDLGGALADTTVPPDGPPVPPPPLPPPPPERSGPRVLSYAFAGSSPGSVNRVRLTFSEPVKPDSIDRYDFYMTGPNGYIPYWTMSVAPVPGSDNTQFDAFFPTVTTEGVFDFQCGPDLVDLGDHMMNQDGDALDGEWGDDVFRATYAWTAPAVQTFTSTDVPKNIPAAGTNVSTLSINQDVNIADLNVTVNVAHARIGDLVLILQSPSGQQVMLINRRGPGANLADTTFDDEATATFQPGGAPYAGSFRPEEPLTAFDNQNARGTWLLILQDRAKKVAGTLNSWSMTISP